MSTTEPTTPPGDGPSATSAKSSANGTSGADGDEPARRRDPRVTWSAPVDRLRLGDVPAEALNLNVTGKRLAGPLQGFGQLWQKTYAVTFEGAAPDPTEVVAVWKREFASFWPAGARFYAPFTEIAPGEVGLINQDVPGRQVLSTGVMVIYADDESFTFMTPEGHIFAAWITFSSERDAGGATSARINVLLRASDPFFELMLMTGGHAKENRHWVTTLSNLAARFGATGSPSVEQHCVDPNRQWRHVTNIRHNAAIRTSLWQLRHPRRMLRGSK